MEDLTGRMFGDWKVIEKWSSGKHRETRWLCECQCELKTRRVVTGHALRSGSSKSCGHNTTGLKDLTGKTFGNWKVLERSVTIGNRTMWKCECQCEKHTLRLLDSYTLRKGISKSCGCLTQQLRKETSLIKYGVTHPAKAKTNRSEEQLNMVESKENLIKAIKNNFDEKPTAIQLSELLGINRGSVKCNIHKYGLEDMIEWGTKPISGYERSLARLFPCNNYSDRTVLNGKELDLYYPDSNFAIEFNGNYWHSELKKDEYYHQSKSILALKKGVQVFNIFEYEWIDPSMKTKLISMINHRLNTNNLQLIPTTDCTIEEVTPESIESLINTSSINQYNHDSNCINVAVKYQNEIVGCITFERIINTQNEYNINGEVWNYSLNIPNIKHTIIDYFISKYNASKIVYSLDISKYNCMQYTELGFNIDKITEPDYTWIDIETNKIINRHEATDSEETMYESGLVKIYDSGRVILVYKR